MNNQNQKGIASFLAIIIVIVIGVLAIGGVFAYQYWWAPEEEIKPSENTIDKTAGWKTYRNDEYGFELKYDANKYKIENDTYGWPYAIVLFSKFGAGQSYYLAIEVWDNESAFNSIRGYIVPNPPVVKKIGNKYITLWNINQEEEVDQIISTFKFIEKSTQPALTREQAQVLVSQIWGGCTPDTCGSVTVTVQNNNGQYTVTAIYEGLRDDSTSAQKKVAPAYYSNNVWTLGNATVTQRCQPGRGHQDFSSELCF